MRSVNVKKLAMLGMLAAIAYVVMVIGRLPLVPSVGFLKYDPKDAVIAISGLMFGPLPALGVTVVVSLIEMFTVSETGWIGLIMNIVSTAAFVCPAVLIYRKDRTIRGAIIGLLAGTLTMTGVMVLWNYLLTPIYMGYPRKAVAEMLLPAFVPFNLLKAGLNSALVLLLYKPLMRILRALKFMPESTGGAVSKKSKVGVLIFSLALLATCILIVLALRGIL